MTTKTISALVTAYGRPDQTLKTLDRILACQPPPAEVLVHVDGGRHELAELLRSKFSTIRIFVSQTHVGPGGGRSIMLREAANDLCASFDDESFPKERDYFATIAHAFDSCPDAAIITGIVIDRSPISNQRNGACIERVATFQGGACVFRRSQVLEAGPFVPLRIAYGMEEVDLSLRLFAMGRPIYRHPGLVVIHDSDLSHRLSPEIASTSASNILLHCYLRYPLYLWPIGLVQYCRYIYWSMKTGRGARLLDSLRMSPGYIWRYRQFRRVVPARVVMRFIGLKRKGSPAHGAR